MKIVIDENMPYAFDLFSQIGQVIVKAGREITTEDLIDVDALMIRSVTKVNETLLEKANCLKFVGSATAGMDHVDQDLLAKRGIFFTQAPGCNKVGVSEYVLSALMILAKEQGFQLKDKSIGIVGAGQVGSYLEGICHALGIKTYLNDPLKEQAGDTRVFTSLDELLDKSDIITLHTSLTHDGIAPSYHLMNKERLKKLRADQVLINAARGPVVDNQALKQRLTQNDGFTCILDVFETEPVVDLELLPMLRFATPHIAGYGLEGKARGTTMIFNSFCQFMKGSLTSQPVVATPEALLPQAPISSVQVNQVWDWEMLYQLIHLVYDIRIDDALFRRSIRLDSPKAQSKMFDKLRKEYWDRREYSSIRLSHPKGIDLNPLAQIGFKLQS